MKRKSVSIISTQPTDSESSEADFDKYLQSREAARRSQPNPKRRRSKTQPLYDAIRRLISGRNYGEKRPDQNRIHPKLKNETINRRLNHGVGKHKYKGSLATIPNYLLDDHFAGRTTAYYLGRDERTRLSLASIDIDCQKANKLGSAAGARAFAQWLNNRFPGRLWLEPSPGGDGMHCDFLLDKESKYVEAADVNAALYQFQTWLQHAARDFHIELVEIKGTLPVIKRTENGWVYTSGTYCSLPRTITLQELEALAPIKLSEITSLKLTPAEKKLIPKRKAGSCGPIISEDEQETFAALGCKWVDEFGEIRLDTRHKITAQTVKGYLAVTTIHKRAKLRKDQFGVKWAERTWKNLYDDGSLEQAWNPSRWKWIRDWFSAYGQNFWTDNTYFVAEDDEGKPLEGEGQACVWNISAECVRRLADAVTLMKQGGDTFLHKRFTDLLPRGNCEYRTPKRIRKASPLVEFIRWADTQIDYFTTAA
jgi:hypothetical protein